MVESTRSELQIWLEQDDAESRPHRAKRLADVLAVIPDEEMVLFGGMASAQAYIEIRLAYINGLYLATVLLSLACIEQDLAGVLYSKGDDSAATARLEKILRDSLAKNIITEDEFQTFEQLREVRNSYTHFRPPTHKTAWERRAMETATPINDILEADATSALCAIGSHIERSSTIYADEKRANQHAGLSGLDWP